MSEHRRGGDAWRLGVVLSLWLVLIAIAGLCAGAEGWSFDWLGEPGLLIDIRAPRTLGALLAGACLGLAGAIAQGLFRNPLADPYLLGSASGAGLAVTAALALSAAGTASTSASALSALAGAIGMTGAAFVGALAGVSLTLALAGGARHSEVLLLAGVVVGMILGAVTELLALGMPEILRSRQAFMLGSTSLVDWPGVAALAASGLVAATLAAALVRALDALLLGEDTAATLGINLGRSRLQLVAALALATGAAVAQTGLIAFVGLAAAHLVRHRVVVSHRALLMLSMLAGAALLGLADLAARLLLAPRELPVGLLTAAGGGTYLLVLLHKRRLQGHR